MTSQESVFGPFREDHRHVLSRLQALEHAIGSGGSLSPATEQEVLSVVALLGRQFDSHVTAEDRVLYPALVEAFPEAAQALEPLQAEHAEMRSMLARLAALLAQPRAGQRDEQIVVMARDLVDLLRIHIRKEEQSVFNVAARVLTESELASLARRITGHREVAGLESRPPDAKGPTP
jgi:hemerythrin-like domain-containing protein